MAGGKDTNRVDGLCKDSLIAAQVLETPSVKTVHTASGAAGQDVGDATWAV